MPATSRTATSAQNPSNVVLLPDAGPLITLAYADALDLLLRPGWAFELVDMVLHEVTRNHTPTSDKINLWVQRNKFRILPTQTMALNQATRRPNAGELALQEIINQFALQEPPQTAVLLFEDHRIARSSFFLPHHCQRVSTRAFLIFLAEKGWIERASDIERKAIQAGRQFSQLRFPSG